MAGSPEDGDGWGGTEFRNKHQASPKVQVFLQIEIFSPDEFRLCPEVRVCGFGSSPRFGDELMEIGVAAGRSVALGEVWCGMGGRYIVWYGEEVHSVVVWYVSSVVHV